MVQGDVQGALTYFKLCVHHDPLSLEALQAVGALYILMGDLNTGRHYLRKALDRWEGMGSNLIKVGLS